MRRFAQVLVPVVFLAACGDNNGGTSPDGPRAIDASMADAMVDAGAIDATVDAVVIDAMVDATPIDAPPIDAPPIDAPPIDAPPIDAPPIDAPPIDAPPIDAPPALGTHLLLTEVKTTDNSEFVEIHNPTNAAIDLRNYYLTDHQSYFLLPGVVAGNTTQPTTDASDFLVRFPVGATIAAHATITVAADAVGFETDLLAVPTYTIQELGNSTPMEVIWAGGTPNPGLTNAGEMVALFFWDGVADTVNDVDLVNAGNAPTAANTFIAKTPVDGPDLDTTTTAYAADLFNPVFDMQTDTPNGTSYKRITHETGQELQLGTGNGITGDDETSESIRTTWDSQPVGTGYTVATPGVVPITIDP